MNSPCELCYAKFGKYITDECDKYCEFAKIEHQNEMLKNRCFVLSRGALCAFCPFECANKANGVTKADIEELLKDGAKDGNVD